MPDISYFFEPLLRIMLWTIFIYQISLLIFKQTIVYNIMLNLYVLHSKTFYRGWHVKMGLNFFGFCAWWWSYRSCCPIRWQGFASKLVTCGKQLVNRDDETSRCRKHKNNKCTYIWQNFILILNSLNLLNPIYHKDCIRKHEGIISADHGQNWSKWSPCSKCAFSFEEAMLRWNSATLLLLLSY